MPTINPKPFLQSLTQIPGGADLVEGELVLLTLTPPAFRRAHCISRVNVIAGQVLLAYALHPTPYNLHPTL